MANFLLLFFQYFCNWSTWSVIIFFKKLKFYKIAPLTFLHFLFCISEGFYSLLQVLAYYDMSVMWGKRLSRLLSQLSKSPLTLGSSVMLARCALISTLRKIAQHPAGTFLLNNLYSEIEETGLTYRFVFLCLILSSSPSVHLSCFQNLKLLLDNTQSVGFRLLLDYETSAKEER